MGKERKSVEENMYAPNLLRQFFFRISILMWSHSCDCFVGLCVCWVWGMAYAHYSIWNVYYKSQVHNFLFNFIHSVQFDNLWHVQCASLIQILQIRFIFDATEDWTYNYVYTIYIQIHSAARWQLWWHFDYENCEKFIWEAIGQPAVYASSSMMGRKCCVRRMIEVSLDVRQRKWIE